MAGRVGPELSEHWASKAIVIKILQTSAMLVTTDTGAVLPVGPLGR